LKQLIFEVSIYLNLNLFFFGEILVFTADFRNFFRGECPCSDSLRSRVFEIWNSPLVEVLLFHDFISRHLWENLSFNQAHLFSYFHSFHRLEAVIFSKRIKSLVKELLLLLCRDSQHLLGRVLAPFVTLLSVLQHWGWC